MIPVTPIERGTWKNPVHVSMTARPSVKDTIGMVLITVLPVAIAILMQKPALRQMLIMRATHMGKEFCRMQADFWNTAGDELGTMYNKAKS